MKGWNLEASDSRDHKFQADDLANAISALKLDLTLPAAAPSAVPNVSCRSFSEQGLRGGRGYIGYTTRS